MATVSPALLERARKYQATFLRRLSELGQVHVAHAIDLSESEVSKSKNGDLWRVCLMLAALDLKIVPAEWKCYSPAKVDWLLTGARAYAQSLSHEELLDEDVE